MPRFLFMGSSVDGNEHGLHVLHLQFIFIWQTALELSELGVKRGLGCKVQREQGRKGKWCLMLFQGLRVIGHCVRIDYQCYWKRGRWVSIPFLNGAAFWGELFLSYCLWSCAWDGIYGLHGRIGFAGMGLILEAFLPGSESCVKIEDYSRKACLVLEKRRGFRCLFLKWFEVLSAC